MIRQFVDAEVLVTWEERGKKWGFFVGNEKPGRLPHKSHINRYKNLPPNYPGLVKEDAGNMPRGIGLDWIGKDRIGEEQESKSELSFDQSEKEQKMKLK